MRKLSLKNGKEFLSSHLWTCSFRTPISFSKPSSVSTLMPSWRALFSLLPASSPATTELVFSIQVSHKGTAGNSIMRGRSVNPAYRGGCAARACE